MLTFYITAVGHFTVFIIPLCSVCVQYIKFQIIATTCYNYYYIYRGMSGGLLCAAWQHAPLYKALASLGTIFDDSKNKQNIWPYRVWIVRYPILILFLEPSHKRNIMLTIVLLSQISARPRWTAATRVNSAADIQYSSVLACAILLNYREIGKLSWGTQKALKYQRSQTHHINLYSNHSVYEKEMDRN